MYFDEISRSSSPTHQIENSTMPPKGAIGKKKKSAYMTFAAEVRAGWKKEGKKVPVPEQGKYLGEKWREMSDAEKAKYA